MVPGFEMFGKEEFDALVELWDRSGGIGFRYKPGAYAAAEFEKRFAERVAARYAHAVSSGTAAIGTVLAAVGVQAADEVITTCHTFIAVVEAILNRGAIPVLAEIDESYNLDPASVEEKITSRTKAIVAVPMWAACDNDRLMAIAQKHNITFVEDSAQNLFGTYRGKCTGTFGAMGSFSFDFGKTMTCGEGGMVVTDDEELCRRAAEYSDHGHMHDASVPRGRDPRRSPGFNYRLSEYNAAVGLAQLSKVDDLLCRQRANYKRMEEGLAKIEGLSLRQFADKEGQIASNLFFRLPSRQAAAVVGSGLANEGIATGNCPSAIEWHFAGYWQHIFKHIPGYDLDNLAAHWPRSDEFLHTTVDLFVGATMTKEAIDHTVETVRLEVTKALEKV